MRPTSFVYWTAFFLASPCLRAQDSERSEPARETITIDVRTTSGEAVNLALRRLCASGPPPSIVAIATREPVRNSIPSYLLAGVLPVAAPGGSLECDPPCQVSLMLGNRLLASEAVADGADRVTFSIDIDKAMANLATVRVSLRDNATSAPILDGTALWNASGNPRLIAIQDGESVIPYVPPGDGVFMYSGGLHAAHVLRIDVAQGRTTEAVLRLMPTAPVKGRVEIPRGAKVACHLLVLPLNADVPAPPAWAAPKVPVSRDGGFALNSGPRGPQALIVVADGYALAAVRVDNTAGAVDRVSVPLVRGTAVQLTTNRRGLEIPFVHVETEASVPLYSSNLAEPRTLRLAPGKYRVRYMDYRSEWREKLLVVEDKDVNITIP